MTPQEGILCQIEILWIILDKNTLLTTKSTVKLTVDFINNPNTV
jgi:hypothetical protein